jgi:hypothetical protein
MDQKTFQYIISHQAEWAIKYHEQEANRKLMKNRAEKQRVKEAKIKSNDILNGRISNQDISKTR